MQEWLLNLLTANTVAIMTAVGLALWWFIRRSFSHEAQIKNLGSKIDHLEEKIDQKIDIMIKHLDEKMDRMDQKMDRQDNEAKERITRLEKYFDVIMQTQIKKNSEQLKMEF